MSEEYVVVSAGGMPYTGFRRVMVRASFKETAREFRLTIAAEAGPYATAWVFKSGTAVTITANGSLLLTGYVDRYQPKLGEHSQAEIDVAGRSKSQDAIDSSAVHDKGQWKDKTVLEILKDLDKFGVGFKTDQQLEKIPVYRLTPGETVHRVGEKLCRSQGLFMPGQADGSVNITKAGSGRNGPLIEGRNIKTIEADHDWSGRHSDVIVRGQRPFGHGKDALEIEARAMDASVGRYRPVIVHNDDDTDQKRAKKRADHRRDTEAGEAVKANVTVQGWHDDGGALWEPGNLVYVDSAFAAIHQDMAIDTVEYTQERSLGGGSGSTAVLSLVDPRALGGKGGKGGSAGGAWGSGAGG